MDTRDALLAVTGRLFAEHGWRGTTTRRIAEEAGVNEVTLFRHFGSKELLLRAAIERAASVGPVGALPEIPGSVRDDLLAWAQAVHAHVLSQRKMIRTALAEFEEHPEVAPVSCEGAMVAMAQMVSYLTQARERGLIANEGSLVGATVMLMNAIFMDGITRDVVPSCSEMTSEQAVECFVDLMLRALGGVR
ncbi:MAG: helix-turn-helix domain-containing protein [Gemmatimonadales bacterium]|jgi:AcrR family transcriptional regulator|nr:helix-turn-helix domain-containing protein [Gemmatimonadales bacterium]HQW65499.1 helix-turn-helix domain-containing protein [Gemmatimonadales bacterium]